MHEMSGLVGLRVRDVNSFLCKHLVTECNLYLKHIMCPLGSPLQQSRFLRASQLLSIRFAQANALVRKTLQRLCRTTRLSSRSLPGPSARRTPAAAAVPETCDEKLLFARDDCDAS